MRRRRSHLIGRTGPCATPAATAPGAGSSRSAPGDMVTGGINDRGRYLKTIRSAPLPCRARTKTPHQIRQWFPPHKWTNLHSAVRPWDWARLPTAGRAFRCPEALPRSIPLSGEPADGRPTVELLLVAMTVYSVWKMIAEMPDTWRKSRRTWRLLRGRMRRLGEKFRR